MLVEHPFRIKNASGDVITGDFRFTNENIPKPVIIVCHGFTAHKDWGPFPYFGQRLAELGFASAVFNFSHNGIGNNFKRFTEFEKFSVNTIKKELEDTQGVVDAITTGDLREKRADPSRIGIVGHSRGGGVAILSASFDTRLRAVAGWSTVSSFVRYTDHQKEVWERQGYYPVTIKSARTSLRYGIEILRDLEANKALYDLKAAVQRLQCPMLLIHGNADVSVRPKEAEELYAVANKSKTELILLDQVGHMYGSTSPFLKTDTTIEHIIDITAQWFHRNL